MKVNQRKDRKFLIISFTETRIEVLMTNESFRYTDMVH